jgi:hypothetical protein
MKRMTWYIIVNATRKCLAVYGSALRNEAEKRRDELRAKFPLAVVDLEEREFSIEQRPSVGDYV